MEKVNLSAPWEILYHEIDALFGNDPEIDIKIDDVAKNVSLFISNAAKADALQKILPEKKMFGDIEVKITVVPANDEDSPLSLYQRAFFGNPAYEYAVEHGVEGDFNATHIIFQNKVVQFFCDNIADVNGNRSTLYEIIAEDIIEDHAGVFFCTDDLEDDDECCGLPFVLPVKM